MQHALRYRDCWLATAVATIAPDAVGDVNTGLPQSGSDSPEWKLVLACARTRLDSAQRSRILNLIDEPLRWNVVTKLAAEHRTEALLAWHLAGEFSGCLAPGTLDNLGTTARRVGQWSLRLGAEMLRLFERFENAGLVVIPYKGPALAAAAYGNLALRYSDDLDFVLNQRDVPAAFTLLLESGLGSELDLSNPRHDRFLRRGNVGQYLFRPQVGGFPIELHTERTMRYFPVPLDWNGLRSRTRTEQICGRSVRTFSTEDLLVLLSVHGAKHFWSRLTWICDIAELVQSQSGVDWNLSEGLARRAGCRRMWLLGLELARDVLEAPLPERVLRWIESDSGVAALKRRIQLVPDGQGPTGGVAKRMHFRMLAHESRFDGMRQCIRVSTRMTEDDWRGVNLPEWAEGFYLAVRPWRLLLKYGLSVRHGAGGEHPEE